MSGETNKNFGFIIVILMLWIVCIYIAYSYYKELTGNSGAVALNIHIESISVFMVFLGGILGNYFNRTS